MEYAEQRMVQEAAKQGASAAFFTPLNTLLLGVALYAGYKLFLKTPEQPTLPPQEAPIVFRTYTPRTLIEFNGQDGRPIYLAIRGRVFDVSRKAHFYGPGGPYANFAGRDATKGLAHGSFDEDMLTKDLGAPLYDFNELGAEEMETLKGWEETFGGNYPVIGRLVSVGELEAEKEKEKK
ncbi:related to DNA damage response protein [Cephalotrichum gorgonifer]|uniref:Related to DNA damage response protein n=1 Tax=Cephalotrichum gorgonifer TaxID=2041049 RepID=A0AAE8N386_9PEZI|nr:related to DNA damage response protein [Cephalotrichum gorgonifer]